MARHCMRPGCDRPAAARLSYDTEAAAVWLDLPLDDGQPAQQVCSIHAATLTAPLGWTVTDRRLVAVGPGDALAQLPIVEGEVSPFTEARRAARASGVPEAPAQPDDEKAGAPGVPAAVVKPTQTGAEEAPVQSVQSVQSQAETMEHPQGDGPAEESAESGSQTSIAQSASDKGASDKDADSPKPDTKSKGTLLERAFEWTGPQHSVLTTGHDHRPRRRD